MKKALAILVCYYNEATWTMDLEHLGSLELFKTSSKTIYQALVSFFEKNNIPWTGLISMLLDSCAAMRGNFYKLNAIKCKKLIRFEKCNLI